MALPAQVTSIEAVEFFRAALIVYLGKARAAVEEISSEMQRARSWIQIDQRRKWDQELRLRQRRLEEAKSELFNARLSSTASGTSLQLMAVQRNERAFREAEAKLALLKKWDREMTNRTDPLVKQIEQLQGYLATDMEKAVLYLAQVVKALDAYTAVAPPPPGGKGPAA
jgi:hypothetical protein